MKKILLFTALLLTIVACDKNEVDPDMSKAKLSATVNDNIFISPELSFSIENNQGLVITAYDGDRTIEIGTSWPVDPGTYSLNYWNPYNNKRFFAQYNYASQSYATIDNSGEITIHSVRSEGNKIVELTASFAFEGYSITNDRALVSSGRINYSESN